MAKEVIGAQGEITIIKIDAIPEGMKTKPAQKISGGWVISHSESGSHHVLSGGDVLESARTAMASSVGSTRP